MLWSAFHFHSVLLIFFTLWPISTLCVADMVHAVADMVWPISSFPKCCTFMGLIDYPIYTELLSGICIAKIMKLRNLGWKKYVLKYVKFPGLSVGNLAISPWPAP